MNIRIEYPESAVLPGQTYHTEYFQALIKGNTVEHPTQAVAQFRRNKFTLSELLTRINAGADVFYCPTRLTIQAGHLNDEVPEALPDSRVDNDDEDTPGPRRTWSEWLNHVQFTGPITTEANGDKSVLLRAEWFIVSQAIDLPGRHWPALYGAVGVTLEKMN